MRTRVFLLLASAFVFAAQAPAAAPDYVPMKVIQTDAVTFPRRATEIGVTSGEVRVAISVDEKGKLTDQLVTGYSHPLLAETAVQALKRWSYEPAWVNGQPRSAMVDLMFQFESVGMVVVDMTASSYVAMRDFRLRPNAFSYSACTMRQLDRIPTPTKVVKPGNPGNSSKGKTIVVPVLFYIDEQGAVRMPAVNRETDALYEAFAAAALNAVSQWQFEPPLSKGKPVLVSARQDFTFRPNP